MTPIHMKQISSLTICWMNVILPKRQNLSKMQYRYGVQDKAFTMSSYNSCTDKIYTWKSH